RVWPAQSQSGYLRRHNVESIVTARERFGLSNKDLDDFAKRKRHEREVVTPNVQCRQANQQTHNCRHTGPECGSQAETKSSVLRQNRRCICSNRNKSRMAERNLPSIAEQQVQTERYR